LGEAVRAEQKKAAQFPQVWAVFDITAKTYFVLYDHYTLLVQTCQISVIPFLWYRRALGKKAYVACTPVDPVDKSGGVVDGQ
jgi:hypothetical protein